MVWKWRVWPLPGLNLFRSGSRVTLGVCQASVRSKLCAQAQTGWLFCGSESVQKSIWDFCSGSGMTLGQLDAERSHSCDVKRRYQRAFDLAESRLAWLRPHGSTCASRGVWLGEWPLLPCMEHCDFEADWTQSAQDECLCVVSAWSGSNFLFGPYWGDAGGYEALAYGGSFGNPVEQPGWAICMIGEQLPIRCNCQIASSGTLERGFEQPQSVVGAGYSGLICWTEALSSHNPLWGRMAEVGHIGVKGWTAAIRCGGPMLWSDVRVPADWGVTCLD